MRIKVNNDLVFKNTLHKFNDKLNRIKQAFTYIHNLNNPLSWVSYDIDWTNIANNHVNKEIIWSTIRNKWLNKCEHMLRETNYFISYTTLTILFYTLDKHQTNDFNFIYHTNYFIPYTSINMLIIVISCSNIIFKQLSGIVY